MTVGATIAAEAISLTIVFFSILISSPRCVIRQLPLGIRYPYTRLAGAGFRCQQDYIMNEAGLSTPCPRYRTFRSKRTEDSSGAFTGPDCPEGSPNGCGGTPPTGLHQSRSGVGVFNACRRVPRTHRRGTRSVLRIMYKNQEARGRQPPAPRGDWITGCRRSGPSPRCGRRRRSRRWRCRPGGCRRGCRR